VIEAVNLDPSEPQPDGWTRQSSDALPDWSDGCGVGGGLPVLACAAKAQMQAHHEPAARFISREVLNALLYLARSGGRWRMQPEDCPPWQTVYWWFWRFVRGLLFHTMHEVALILDRERAARAEPACSRSWPPVSQGALGAVRQRL